jgi:HSP20 family protein
MAFGNDPFEQMNRLFEQTRRAMYGPGSAAGGETLGFDATVSVEPVDGGYVAVADLPGFEREDLRIRFEDGVLTIEGVSEVSEETPGMSHRQRRTVGERVSIPGHVIEADITATYRNGVLEVTLPTEDEAEVDDAHHIDIQ